MMLGFGHVAWMLGLLATVSEAIEAALPGQERGKPGPSEVSSSVGQPSSAPVQPTSVTECASASVGGSSFDTSR